MGVDRQGHSFEGGGATAPLAPPETPGEKVEPRKLSHGDSNPLAGSEYELLEMRAKFEPARGSQVTFQLRGVAMTFGAVNQVCMVAGYRAPAKLLDVHIQLVVYFDRTVLEVFASEGLVYFPFPINVNPNDRIAVVIPIAGTAEFHRFDGVQVEIELDAMIEMIEASNQDVRDRRSLRKRATCERLSGGSVAA